MKKLSIITINRNNENGLLKTINSVIFQTSQDFEYIIIDGASSDGSKEEIERLAISDKRLTFWCSESDSGIYNAMNKGITQAKGEYLLFLNSGDYLFDKHVISDFFKSEFDKDIVSGDIVLMEETPIIRKAVSCEELEFEHLYNNKISHPTSFIKRRLFEQYGMYNESYKIVSDWEFFLKCLVIYNCSYTHWDRTVCCFDMTGLSSSSKYKAVLEQETESVYSNYLPLVYKSYKKLSEENFRLKIIDPEFREYLNLKHGKFRFIVRFLIFLKKKLK